MGKREYSLPNTNERDPSGGSAYGEGSSSHLLAARRPSPQAACAYESVWVSSSICGGDRLRFLMHDDVRRTNATHHRQVLPLLKINDIESHVEPAIHLFSALALIHARFNSPWLASSLYFIRAAEQMDMRRCRGRRVKRRCGSLAPIQPWSRFAATCRANRAFAAGGVLNPPRTFCGRGVSNAQNRIRRIAWLSSDGARCHGRIRICQHYHGQ